jgi:hypothetical protein
MAKQLETRVTSEAAFDSGAEDKKRGLSRRPAQQGLFTEVVKFGTCCMDRRPELLR